MSSVALTPCQSIPIEVEPAPTSDMRLSISNVLEVLAKVDFDVSQIEQPSRERLLKYCAATTTLSFVGNQIPKNIKSIASFFKNVTEISVAQAVIDERYFAALSEFSSLCELKVFMSTITCFEAIQYLTRVDTLHTLFFSNCEGIDDSALVHMEVFTGLRSLSFISCKTDIEEDGGLDRRVITDAGAEYLTCLPELRTLDLCQSAIGDSTLRTIAARLGHLVTLSLSGCEGITDIGLVALATVPTLRTLQVRGCSVSEVACGEIARLVGGLEVVRA